MKKVLQYFEFFKLNNLYFTIVVNVLQNHVRSYEEKQCSVMQNKMDEFIARLNEVTETASFNAIKKLVFDLRERWLLNIFLDQFTFRTIHIHSQRYIVFFQCYMHLRF